jgi:LacI family transcriptional regulator
VTEALGGGPGDRFDALVIGNNDMALGTLEAIALLGLRVPDDVAVVSLDDLPLGHLLASPLTAAVQPSFSVGREALRSLLSRIAAPGSGPRLVRLRAGFVHRPSCGCVDAVSAAVGVGEVAAALPIPPGA